LDFEHVFEAEIAYFQNRLVHSHGMLNLLLLSMLFAFAFLYLYLYFVSDFPEKSSDTDGSKAISEGSSTAEGAASAAEGHHDIYYL
jgi:hypothetical protein